MENRSKLLRLVITNLRCIGPDPVEIALDNVVCLVGRNNAGKSTILKAYELAYGDVDFSASEDRCRWAPEGASTTVELYVHIPDGIANVDPKWKATDGSYRVVRSKWEWSPSTNFSRVRTTWDPAESKWAEDGKAGGADNVFKSRLPRPLRIGSLEDAHKTEEVLLTLALDPLVNEMGKYEVDPKSPVSKSIGSIVALVNEIASSHQKRFDGISADVQKGFAGVFPELNVRLDVAMSPPTIKIKELLKSGSGVRIREGDVETALGQQGTGTRRALFWAMLQVHNAIKRRIDFENERKKALQALLKKEKDEKKKEEIESQINSIGSTEPELGSDDPALPGYLLLIDEPENALHPSAARSAQRHLYNLASDPDWQVLMTTHSPYFVNPFEDHTTIVRLAREAGDKSALTNRTYRADDVKFDENQKRQLQALQQMEPGFSEVFFGAYPILVEGDTEHAAYIAAVAEPKLGLVDAVTVIRARGKAILPCLIRMLRHFKIGFGVAHDVDWPFNRKGGGGAAMWAVNKSILEEIEKARSEGLRVRHRCSIPDFERFLDGDEVKSEKPLETYQRIIEQPELQAKAQAFFVDLHTSGQDHPFAEALTSENALQAYEEKLRTWAKANGEEADIRLVAKENRKGN